MLSRAGASAEDYDAPLFVAWQLTNGCNAYCLACCEESGPGRAWSDELTRDQAMAIAHSIVAARVPYVAFGGGEPLGVAHCWDIFQILTAGGVALKLETNGVHIDDEAADRLAMLAVDCVQISVDGATAPTHEKVRPGSSFAAAIAAIQRLVLRGQPPQSVFVPNRLNLHEAIAAYDQALALGCSAFVTGPMMRLGRAAASWDKLACSQFDWEQMALDLHEHARLEAAIRLSIYPWDIITEMQRRLESPQAMLLIVPNGKVKLLNALPFAVADLRHDTLSRAWRRYLDGWRAPQVRAFVAACRGQPALLLHANEIWTIGEQAKLPQGS
jgi:MoaA/NifB/PqqE/SkfB family radical SAM enzyme